MLTESTEVVELLVALTIEYKLPLAAGVPTTPFNETVLPPLLLLLLVLLMALFLEPEAKVADLGELKPRFSTELLFGKAYFFLYLKSFNPKVETYCFVPNSNKSSSTTFGMNSFSKFVVAFMKSLFILAELRGLFFVDDEEEQDITEFKAEDLLGLNLDT